MKLGFGACNINPIEPVMRFGGRYGTEKYTLPVKGDLICPILLIENSDGTLWLHVSLANPDIELPSRNLLKEQIETALGRKLLFTICGTHTHYTPNINKDRDYLRYTGEQIIQAIREIEMKEYADLTYRFTYRYFDKVGQSRITGHTVNNLYLNTLSIYSGEKRIATMIVYNCHASTMTMRAELFSSAGPGLLLRQLGEKYPDEFFTYMCGAAGDVSTRNTRHGQEYEDMVEMERLVYAEVEEQLAMPSPRKPFHSITLTELMLPVEREYRDLEHLTLPENLSEREKEVIEIEKEDQKKGRVPVEELPRELLFQRLEIGNTSLIFTPFELFSEYIDYIDKEHTVLVNLANDRVCYLSGFHLNALSFEVFGESVSLASKYKIKSLLEEWSMPHETDHQS